MKANSYKRGNILVTIFNAKASDKLIYLDKNSPEKGFKSGFLVTYEDEPEGKNGPLRVLKGFTTHRKPTPNQLKNGLNGAKIQQELLNSDKMIVDSLNELQKGGFKFE